MRTKVGCVTMSWCLFLGIVTAGTLFWVPFCIDSCKDMEAVCEGCGTVKTKI